MEGMKGVDPVPGRGGVNLLSILPGRGGGGGGGKGRLPELQLKWHRMET